MALASWEHLSHTVATSLFANVCGMLHKPREGARREQQTQKSAEDSTNTLSPSQQRARRGMIGTATAAAAATMMTTTTAARSAERPDDSDSEEVVASDSDNKSEGSELLSGRSVGRFSTAEKSLLFSVIWQDRELLRFFLHRLKSRAFAGKSWMCEVGRRFNELSGGSQRTQEAVRHHLKLRWASKAELEEEQDEDKVFDLLLRHAVVCTRPVACTRCLQLARLRVKRGLASCGAARCTMCHPGLPDVLEPFDAVNLLIQVTLGKTTSGSSNSAPGSPMQASPQSLSPFEASRSGDRQAVLQGRVLDLFLPVSDRQEGMPTSVYASHLLRQALSYPKGGRYRNDQPQRRQQRQPPPPPPPPPQQQQPQQQQQQQRLLETVSDCLVQLRSNSEESTSPLVSSLILDQQQRCLLVGSSVRPTLSPRASSVLSVISEPAFSPALRGSSFARKAESGMGKRAASSAFNFDFDYVESVIQAAKLARTMRGDAY